MRAISLSVLVLVGCSGFPSATLHEPELCKTVTNQLVPGVPLSGQVTVPVQLDFRPELAELGVKGGHAYVTRVSLSSPDISDLGFITTVVVTLAGDGGTVPIVQYQPAAALDITGNQTDLLEPALKGPLHLEVTVSGTLPAQTWHANVAVCVDVEAQVST